MRVCVSLFSFFGVLFCLLRAGEGSGEGYLDTWSREGGGIVYDDAVSGAEESVGREGW